MIDEFAEHFGLDPDFVFSKKSFATVTNFLIKWKEQAEYNERFNYLWGELNSNPGK